ncbi:MAG: hypothetical protein SVU88_00515 [Candidatus Nanohaloarchaea archaeon]|nr:hypothetical protein [Candidatus Nanohaloarchaea archaeon]
MADVDYEELVEGTVDEVKERVEDDDIDATEVLAAEKANKDRVTLVEWLEERVEEQAAASEAASGDAADSLAARVLDGVTSPRFAAGLVIGLAAAFAVLSPMAMQDSTLPPSTVSDDVEAYFAQNAEGIPLQSMEVRSAEKLEGSDLYRLDMVLSAEFLNRTVQQNQTAVVTGNGRYLFMTQPIDTQRPLSEQLGATARRTGQG